MSQSTDQIRAPFSYINPKLRADFKATVEDICALIAPHTWIRPFTESPLKYFDQMSLNGAEKALSDCKTYLNILRSSAEAGKVNDSGQILWFALKELGFRPSGDLFDKIQQGDVVEIYDTTNTQVFRNLNFFKYCSYSFEEIVCVPWPDLFDRSQETHLKMVEVSERVYSGQEVTMGPEEHIMIERNSFFKYQMKYKLKSAHPLKGEGKRVAGMLVVEQAELLNPLTLQQEAALFEAHFVS